MLVLVEMIYSNQKGSRRPAQLMGKASNSILQILFSTATERLAGLSLACGNVQSMIVIKPFVSNPITSKLYFEGLPQTARYSISTLAYSKMQQYYLVSRFKQMLHYLQLERLSEAVRDYEVLRRELPDDKEVAESLFHAQVALRKSRGEEVHNMKFGGEVESVSGLEQFRAAVSSPGKCAIIRLRP